MRPSWGDSINVRLQSFFSYEQFYAVRGVSCLYRAVSWVWRCVFEDRAYKRLELSSTNGDMALTN